MNPIDTQTDNRTALERSEPQASAQALALLQEIQDMLAALAEHGEHNSIDIRSLPLAPTDYAFLRDFFGDGEIIASVNTLGMSEIKETRFSGVWWLKHLNTEGEIVAELIEVTQLPDILKAQTQDITQSLDAFKSYLNKQQTQS